MALRVSGTTSHVTGAAPTGFGADADGATVFVWMRRNVAGDGPRAGLFGTSSSRIIANNNAGSLRGILTDPAAVNLLPTVSGSAGVGLWTPLAVSVRDLGGSRSVIVVSATAVGTAATSSTFALGPNVLNCFGIGREVSAASAFTGDYAHFAVWHGALGTDEMQALCRGANPLSVRRGALGAYFPLERDFRNLANPAFFLVPNTAAEIWVDGPQGVAPPARRPFLVPFATGSSAAPIGGVGGGTIGVQVAAAGAAAVRGTGAGTIELTVAAAGAAAVRGTGAGTIGLTVAAAGLVGAGPIVGLGGGTLGVAAVASGTVRVAGQGAGGLAINVVATGLVGSVGALPAVRARLGATRPTRATVQVAAMIRATLQIEGRAEMGQRYIVGEAVEVTLLLTDRDGAPLANATGVAIRAQPPGTLAPRGYAVSAGAGTGQWVATVAFDAPGRWHISGECAGPTPAVDELEVTVAARAVAPA